MKNSLEIIDVNSNTIPRKKSNLDISPNPKLLSKYHEQEMNQNEKIVTNAICMIWAGIILIFMSFIVYTMGLTEELYAGALCGGFIDLFSATILYLFNKSSDTKREYFNNLSNMENEKLLIEIIKETEDENFRNEMVKRVVNKHCKM